MAVEAAATAVGVIGNLLRDDRRAGFGQPFSFPADKMTFINSKKRRVNASLNRQAQ
jgi:hypothetical protein